MLTLEHFAEALAVSRRTVERWRARYGRPRIVRLPSGGIRIPPEELEAAREGRLLEEAGDR